MLLQQRVTSWTSVLMREVHARVHILTAQRKGQMIQEQKILCCWLVLPGTRTRSLLLRRQTPYQLGQQDMNYATDDAIADSEFLFNALPEVPKPLMNTS